MKKAIAIVGLTAALGMGGAVRVRAAHERNYCNALSSLSYGEDGQPLPAETKDGLIDHCLASQRSNRTGPLGLFHRKGFLGVVHDKSD